MLHDFNEDFYGEELHLVVVGYIRPEVLWPSYSYFSLSFLTSLADITVYLQANFSSLEALIAKIHEDRKIAERALELPQYLKYKDDPYLKSSLHQQN